MELRSIDQNKEGEGKDWCKAVKEVYTDSLSQNDVFTLVHKTKRAYTRTMTRGKTRIGWKIKVLVHGIWSELFYLTYLVRGIVLRYLIQGIVPKWFWSKVLRMA